MLALCLLAVALVTVADIDAPFGNGDEVIYAQNVREMLAEGDYGTLRWQGAAGHLRPAAPFVLAALSASFVDGDVGLRLPSALFALIILGCVFGFALRAWRRWDVALLAVILCASAPSFHLFATALLSDPSFVAATTGALLATLWAQSDPRGLVLAAALLGVAVACKSIAVAVPGIALAPWWVLEARKRGSLRIVALSVAAFTVAAAPFFIYNIARFGDVFVYEHLGLSIASRMSGDENIHVGMGGPTAYLSYLWRADGAATTLWVFFGSVVAAGVAIWRRDRALGLVGCYALVVLVVLSLVSTRLPHYLLPMYPAAAIAAAGTYAKLVAAERGPLASILTIALALSLMFSGATNPPVEHFLPSDAAVTLGRIADADTASRADVNPRLPDGPIYSLDWYAPALGYYSGRHWMFRLTSPRMAAKFQQIYLFRKANNVALAPPWPAGEFLLASSAKRLEKSSGLIVERTVAEHGPYILVVARKVPR